MAWQTPIYDRAQSDIDNKTKKGYLNVEDLNRIEGNINYVASLMGITVTTKSWSKTTLPTSSDFQRITSNIDTLKKEITFTTYQDCPELPINHYEKVNLIEALIEAIEGDYMLVLGAAVFSGEGSYTGDNLI